MITLNHSLAPMLAVMTCMTMTFAAHAAVGAGAESNQPPAAAQTNEQRAATERPEQPPVSWVNPELPKGPGLTHHVLPSKAMGHDVGYVVWTPRDYDTSGTTRYAVIYFLHGMGGNESADAAGFSGLVRGSMNDGKIPPAICVFPNGGRSGYSGDVETMIIEELIPLIDKEYPTKAEAASRAVAGFSMGGGGAVRLSLMHPELFCVVGSWGGGMRRGADAVCAAAQEGAATLKTNNYAVLMVNGDKDRPDAYEPLVEKLDKLGLEHEVVVLEDTPHNLGLYYERAGKKMAEFLGAHLKN
jgi:enterochelin esterase-like enzyme